LLLGLGILFWGAASGYSSYQFKQNAVILRGTVTAVRFSSSDGVWVGSPTVKYFLPDGKEKEYTSRFSSSLSSYAEGDGVEILWDPSSGKVRLKSLGDVYFPSLFIVLVAVFVLFGPVFCIGVWIWIWGWPSRKNPARMSSRVQARCYSERTSNVIPNPPQAREESNDTC